MPSSRRLRFVLLLVVALGLVVARGARPNGEHHSEDFTVPEEQAPTAQEQDVVAHEGALFATPQEQAVMTHEEQSLAFLTPEEQRSQAPQVQLPDPTWDSADRHPWLRLLEQPSEPANSERAASEPGQGGLPDLGSALR
jgi:hypothetical protein